MQQLGAEKRLQPLLSRSLAQSRLCPGYCSPLLLSLLLSSFRNYLQAPALLCAWQNQRQSIPALSRAQLQQAGR